MINVKDPPYNAQGDLVTDDTVAVRNAINALPAEGGEIYFPAGTYSLKTWVPTLALLNKPVVLRGEVPYATILAGPGAGPTQKFGIVRSELDVSNLVFENWTTTFDGTNSPALDTVSFVNCTFRNSTQFLQWGGSASEFIGRLVIDRCTFKNLSSAVVSAAMEFDAVYFTRSRVEDCVRYVLRLTGNDVVGRRELVVFSENYVSDLTGGTFQGSAAVARVLQLICQRLVVTDNHVRRVRSVVGGGNANFLYQSSVHAYVAGNHLEDVGTPGDATGGIIQEKNYDAVSSRYIGNLFVQNPPAPGVAAARPPAIQILGRGHTVVHGNEARGLQHALAFFFQNAGDLVVSNNVITDQDAPFGGIIVYGGENVVIEGNVINGVTNTYASAWPYYARGIRVERYAEPVITEVEGQDPVTTYIYHAPTDVRIANNVIKSVRQTGELKAAGVSLYVNGGTPVDGVSPPPLVVRGLSIVGNTIVDCDQGVELRVASTGSFGDTEISYNTFRDNDVTVYAPTPPVAFTTRDNRGWATEASGTATVPAATETTPTSFMVVAHGLARTPPASAIVVTPAEDPGASVRYWVSDVNATSFKLNVEPPLASGMDFSWMAQIL
jgi:hypothetical protein